MPMWVGGDRVDDVVVRTFMVLRAQQLRQRATSDTFETIASRVSARCAAQAYAARGAMVPDDLVELLAGDNVRTAAADRAALVAFWDAQGKPGAYWLGE